MQDLTHPLSKGEGPELALEKGFKGFKILYPDNNDIL
jgi:hypothetical protein